MFMIPFGGLKCFACSSCFVAPFLELEFGDCWEGHLVIQSWIAASWVLGVSVGKKHHQLGQFMPIIPMSCHVFPSIPGWSWPTKMFKPTINHQLPCGHGAQKNRFQVARSTLKNLRGMGAMGAQEKNHFLCPEVYIYIKGGEIICVCNSKKVLEKI